MEMKKIRQYALKAGYPILGALPDRAQSWLENRFESYDKETATAVSCMAEVVAAAPLILTPSMGLPVVLGLFCCGDGGLRHIKSGFSPRVAGSALVAIPARPIYWLYDRLCKKQYREEEFLFTSRPENKLEIGREPFEGTAEFRPDMIQVQIAEPKSEERGYFHDGGVGRAETIESKSNFKLVVKIAKGGEYRFPFSKTSEKTEGMDSLYRQAKNDRKFYVKGERVLRTPKVHCGRFGDCTTYDIDAYKGIIEVDGVPEYEFVIDGNKKWTRHELCKL